MQYLVSAQNNPYHHWQLELLIQSFKFHNLDKQLVIALAETKEPPISNYINNLKNHSNVFIHENQYPINRIYSIVSALENGFIRTPFTLIHSDMVLYKPIQQINYNVTFQTDDEFTIDKSGKAFDLIKKIQEIKNVDTWIPVGSVICFQYATKDFFRRVLELAFLLKSEKIAFATAMLEYFGHLTYNGVYDLESSLLDNNINNFIHYNKGIPSYFNKEMFKFEFPYQIALGDPFETIIKYNVSQSTQYLQNLIVHYHKY